MALDFCSLYVTQSVFTQEVGDIFLIWDGLGVGGGGGGGGQLPKKKNPAQRKSAKKYNAKLFMQKKQGAN